MSDTPAMDALLRSFGELIDKAAAECSREEFTRRASGAMEIMDRAIAKYRLPAAPEEKKLAISGAEESKKED